MGSKVINLEYNPIDNCYYYECPSCESRNGLNLSIEEEINIEMGYGLEILCPNCDEELKVYLD